MYKPETKDEIEFLKNYDADKYKKPSVTTDIVIFTLSENNELSVLLIKRGGYPYKDKWAIPGGFVEMTESIDESARRELEEETGLRGIPIEQFGTFGEVDRDPRMRVISIAYMAFVPKNRLNIHSGDDAADAQIFKINVDLDGFTLIGDRNVIKASDLAFDHELIIKTAIQRLRNRIDYTDDAFNFLANDENFTIYELQKVFEAVKEKKLDTANFRRDFIKKHVDKGFAVKAGEKKVPPAKRPTMSYRRLK